MFKSNPFLRSLYQSSMFYKKKLLKQHLNLINNKIKELKTDENFKNELNKPRTELKYNDDLYSVKYFSENLKKNEKIKEKIDKIREFVVKGNKKVEYSTIDDILNDKNADSGKNVIILSKTSILDRLL